MEKPYINQKIVVCITALFLVSCQEKNLFTTISVHVYH